MSQLEQAIDTILDRVTNGSNRVPGVSAGITNKPESRLNN